MGAYTTILSLKLADSHSSSPETYDQPAINHIAQGCLNNTIDHHEARHRRAALAPYLRPQAIRNNDPVVHKHLNHLCERLELWGEKKPLPIQSAFRCMAGDIVSAITYNGRLNFLDDAEFEPEYVQIAKGSSKLVGLIASFRALGDILLLAVKYVRLSETRPISMNKGPKTNHTQAYTREMGATSICFSV